VDNIEIDLKESEFPCVAKVKQSLYRVPGGCGYQISRQHVKVAKLSARRIGCLYAPRKYS